MELAEHLTALRHDGDLMTKAIRAVDASAPIPTCPEWTMRDLTLHQGEVHRWATTIVAGARTGPLPDDEDFVGPLPDDAALADWFADGHRRLVETLEHADPALECWAFLPAPSPVAFWARRQCHETGIHRADAESASGSISPFAPEVAADGIDELLTRFITRRGGRLKSDIPRSLLVQTDDTRNAWLVRIGDAVETDRTAGDADCVVNGAASDVHLFLWNRQGTDPLTVTGDASLLELWRTSVTIRWGK